MGEYSRIELIKLNIKQFFNNVKYKRKERQLKSLDKFVQNIQMENNGYGDLAPEKNIKNGEEYIKALFWAIKNDNIKNIALTGPYGSGKSSIIQSYLTKHPSTKALNVSLATFDCDNNENENKEFEKKIELGILKQLFYKVDSDIIPQSRYRKIKKKYYRRYLKNVTGIIIVLIMGVAFFSPQTIEIVSNSIKKSAEYYEMNLLTSYLVTAFFGIIAICACTYVLKWFITRFRVKEVNIADKATVSDEKDESSIFDKSMDELVYFFEATDYDVLFIEDLDRFDSTKIFVKLRELNTILNNYDLIKRRIVFVYAIKDDMLKNEERTKFFDFIIPVIPIINSTNSGEKLREKLDVKNGSERSSLYNISSSYITLISPFIEDMRILTNICNEFIVYKKTLMSVDLNDEEMFSMMIFKSLYPKEFSDLEAERGIVKQAFEEKKNFIKSKQIEFDSERIELEKILNGIEGDILNSVRDVKAAFLNYLCGSSDPFIACVINGYEYTLNNIMDEDFDINVFRSGKRARIKYYSRYNTKERDLDDLENDKVAQEYLCRIEYLKNNEEQTKNEMRSRIEKCNKRVAEIHTYSLKKLIELFGSKEIFSKTVQDNKFLVFLLRKGFVNENYADYINYFYPNSITKEDMNFIRAIRMQESLEYGYHIKYVAQVCERIENYEFKQSEALNYDVVDYLITEKRDSEKCKELFVGLAEGGEIFDKFTMEYIERKSNVEIFINLLCKNDLAFWNKVYNNELLSDDKKFEYLKLILENADLKDIGIQNENSYYDNEFTDTEGMLHIEKRLYAMRYFIEKNEFALKKLSKINTDKMIKVIEALNIIFYQIDITDVDKEVLKFIFNSNYYELNINMVHNIFKVYFPEKEEQLNTSNYSIICKTGYGPLVERLEDIDEFREYVLKIVVGQSSNVNEDIKYVEDIIERLFTVDLELCKKVLNQEKVIWNDIQECCRYSEENKSECKLIWNYIIDNEQVAISWDNFISYYKEYNITKTIINWVDKNMDKLIMQKRPEQLEDSMIKDIIVENISVHSLDILIKTYSLDEFDITLSSFDEERIDILIDNNCIPYSSDWLSDMYETAPNCVVHYIVDNKEIFIEDIGNAKLEAETVAELLNKNCFTKEQKIEILQLVDITDISEDIAVKIANMKILVPKDYSEAAWNLLENEKRYQLLLNQIDNYSVQEISEKFAMLAPEYKMLSDISKKHREYLVIDNFGYNDKLLCKLKEKGYISSFKNDEYYEEDIITHRMNKKQRFEIWVKKQ